MSDILTKADIASALRDSGYVTTAQQAGGVIDVLTDVISSAIKSGKKVRLSGFGTFEGKGLAARNARNPKTGEAIAVAASVKPTFKASTALKDFVNGR